MPEFKCQCNGCTGTLHPIPEDEAKGRKNVFTCGRCGCTYGFIVITRTPKCCGLMVKKEHPKKKFIDGPKGEKIDVSIDNPKLKKLVDISIPIHCHVASFGSELACKECNPVCYDKHQMGNPNYLQWCGNEKCPMNPQKSSKQNLLATPSIVASTEKRKRGRPKKTKEIYDHYEG